VLKGLQLDTLQPASRFQTTAWSKLDRTMNSEPEVRKEALSFLIQSYSRPIHSYLKACFKFTDAQIAELIQEFFLWSLESEFFQKADRRRGSFRGLLKNALKNFTTNEVRKSQRLKRGGGRHILSLDLVHPLSDLPSSPDRSPDEILDHQWKETITQKAAGMLRKAYSQKGKELELRTFVLYYTGHKSYRQVAEEVGLTMKDVENTLAASRRKLQSMVIDLVAETVQTPDDLALEMTELFGS
jgi:RNA polymerase sigma factor (sigma-70 family)